MASITYEILSGYLPITVQLINSGLPDNTHSSYGIYSFSGSGTTGVVALKLGCSYVGFEIDPEQVAASNERLHKVRTEDCIKP